MRNVLISVALLLLGLALSIGLVLLIYGWLSSGFRANGNLILIGVLFVALLVVRETYRRVK